MWIYFRSDRTGRPEVWRVPAAGGEGQQMTDKTGHWAWESADGKTLYYTKDRALFGRSLPAGAERQILESVIGWSYFPVEGGIYYIAQQDPQRPRALELRFLEFATGKSKVLRNFEAWSVGGLTVSPDQKTVLWSALMSAGIDLMMIENFR